MFAKEQEVDPLSTPEDFGQHSAPLARTPRRGIYFFIAAVVLLGLTPFAVSVVLQAPWWVSALCFVFFVLLMMSIRVTQQWERALVLRLGKFDRVAGPGCFFIIPFVESTALRIDQRIMATTFSAEEALTADLVPTYVDAVFFWVVTNPEKAWCEIGDYKNMILWSAQTALRDAVGRTRLADISTQRYTLDQELKVFLDAKTKDWGISIISVEIRNILIPKELQVVMTREAQARQESQGRLMLAEMEGQIAELLSDSSDLYAENEVALQMRMASFLNESIKESNGTIVVIPSKLSEGFNADGARIVENLVKLQ